MWRNALAIAAVAAGAIALPATAFASGHADWALATCHAASAYGSKPSMTRLDTLVLDSTHLPKSYLKADAGSLYADASSPSPKAAKYVRKDVLYIAQDCLSVV